MEMFRLLKKELGLHGYDVSDIFGNMPKNNNSLLPSLPQEYLLWVQVARPTIGGKPRTFLDTPFWEKIYKDEYPFKMIIGGRQIRKSTYLSDVIACDATSHPGSQLCYITHDQLSMNSFSKQRLQIETFGQNPILSKFPRHRLGNISEISLKNGRRYTVTLITISTGM